MYFTQLTSASAAAAAAVIEAKVEAFYESKEALRAETRTICALRSSQGQYGIGIFVSGFARCPPACVIAYDMTLSVAGITGCRPWARV